MFSIFWFSYARKNLTERRKKILEFLKKENFIFKVPVGANILDWYIVEYELLEKNLGYLDKVHMEVAIDFILEYADRIFPYWEKVKDCEWVKAYKTSKFWLIKCRKGKEIKSLHCVTNPEPNLAIYKVLLTLKRSKVPDLLEKLNEEIRKQ
jgi:hypothetical protein